MENKNIIKMEKECEYCGKEFKPDKFHPNQRFCCKKCGGKKYVEMNNKKIKEYQKKYKKKNEVKLKQEKKKYYEEHKEEINKRMREYGKKHRKENKGERNEYLFDYKRKKYKENPDFRVKILLGNRIRDSIRRYTKTGKIMKSKEYGINYKAIIEHLKPFPKDIENYHIDHIIPLRLFNLNNPEQVRKAWLPSNLQWLTREENLEKGGRLVMPHDTKYKMENKK